MFLRIYETDGPFRGAAPLSDMRLDRYLAEAGAGTRSEVKKKIAASFVSVNCILHIRRVHIAL